MYCYNCGTENEEGTKFCIKCGKRLVSPATEPEPTYAPTDEVSLNAKHLSMIAIILAAIDTLLIAIVIIFLLFGGGLNHISSLIPSTTSATTLTTTTVIPPTLNPQNGTYLVDIKYTSNTTLLGNIATSGNINVGKGVRLITNGHSIIAAGFFNNSGTIDANDTGSNAGLDAKGQSFPGSYGGSGGSGGGGGGNAGNGATPPEPRLTNALIKGWYQNGMTVYLAGAGGGGGCVKGGYAGNGGDTAAAGGVYTNETLKCLNNGGIGGAGSYGIYIQANGISAGLINANGQQGNAGSTDGGGGGGGGVIFLAYGSQGYITGNYDILGGPVQKDSGAGGNGHVIAYSYGTAPPITPP